MTTWAGSGPPIIAVGASAGGIEPLVKILRSLPVDLPAAVFVVVHGPPTGHTALARVLSRAGPLRAHHPADGQRIEAGRVYVGVPDRHMLVQDGVVRLSRGPRVNRSRPAVDPLFQTAAISHGPQVIGVVLSGALDDGTAGLAAVKEHGGVAVVQHPDDAMIPSMPLSALRRVRVHHVLPANEIGGLVARLVTDMRADRKEIMPRQHATPTNGAGAGHSGEQPSVGETAAPHGAASPFGCPDCGGTLWEVDSNGVLIFACRVGHSFTAAHLLDAQSEDVEGGLWQAFRALEEQAALAGRLKELARTDGQKAAAARFEDQQTTTRQRAESVRRVLDQPGRMVLSEARTPPPYSPPVAPSDEQPDSARSPAGKKPAARS